MTQNNLATWWTENNKFRYKKLRLNEFLKKILHALQSWTVMNRYGVLLTLFLLLSGCMAAPIKPSIHETAEIRTILVVPVESPPLEVIPDLVETRFPVYGQYQYQSMPTYLFLDEAIYRNPGGVLIAGLVSKDDVVPIATMTQPSASTEKIADLEPTASLPQNWTPTFILAQQAVSQLNGKQTKTILSEYYYRLPIANKDRNANLGHWRSAVEHWYDQTMSPIDYRQHGLEHVDAVLEVGIDRYRIFNAQTSLQVLIKLIDPDTRQVIGRTSAKTFTAEDSPQSLLSQEAEGFKRLIAGIGAQLVADDLTDLGLPLKISGQAVADRSKR